MKINLFIIALVFSACAPRLQKIMVPAGYHLVWSDEFDKLDSTKWDYEHGFVRNEELQWYQPENARCENGLLIIEAKRVEQPNPRYDSTSNDWRKKRRNIEYTLFCLITRNKAQWQYGRFEMRARIDVSAGQWPAWWTLGVDKRWPANGEIDIMEYYRGKLLANIACFGGDGKPKWFSNTFPVDKRWAKEFHTWRMDWDERVIGLYCDDKLMNEVVVDSLVNRDGTGYNPFKQPHYMLLNLAIGGMNGGDPSGVEFPRRFEVDFVRVYKR